MIPLHKISACFITKEERYPKEIWNEIQKCDFGEILVLTHCDSPHRKQDLFKKAKYDYIYYQDDDAICSIEELAAQAQEGIINCVMDQGHIDQLKNSRIALLGWGSIFPKDTINILDIYRDKFGEDFLYKRETERIMTYLSYPQNRLYLPFQNLPTALSPDRLSMQPGHYDYIGMVEERCSLLTGNL